MKEDNTPTVTAKKRKLSGHMRLRFETAKRLKKLSRRGRRSASGQESTAEADIEAHSTKEARIRPARTKQAHLATPPIEKSRYRKRQRDKTWLPTHIFHAKRARMTPPSKPLWRFALPITPNEKSFRSIHRTTSAQGAMAWDMSYYSTIQLTGRRSSLNNVLKSLGIERQLTTLRTQDLRKWLLGNLVLTLSCYHREQPSQLIAPVSLLWADRSPSSQAAVAPLDTQCTIWLRVHPAAFLELWGELLRVCKVAKPHVSVVDLRYDIGSIEVVGQEAVDALLNVLWPSSQSKTSDAVSSDFEPRSGSSFRRETVEKDDRGSFFRQLHGINGNILPAGTVIDFSTDDPRLHFPSRRHGLSASKQYDVTVQSLLAKLEDLQRDRPAPDLFHRDRRNRACTNIISQKALERRRRASLPGQLPEKRTTDPKVPIILFTSPARHGKATNGWTLLLPWKWVQIVWYCLMHSTLPSGKQPRFGGLNEYRHLLLEHGIPAFPADYPASGSGCAWELQESQRRYTDWAKRPRSKRVNWETLAISSGKKGEVGKGWACDWSELVTGAIGTTPAVKNNDSHSARSAELSAQFTICEDAMKHLQNTSAFPKSLENGLFMVCIEALPKGVPRVCARIYRLPAKGVMRQQWLRQHPRFRSTSKTGQDQPLPALKGLTAHAAHQKLAASLLAPIALGEDVYPQCDEHDLVGFVTSGNYDLGRGRGRAIGSLSLRLIAATWQNSPPECPDLDTNHLCVVRNSGQTLGRLAYWTAF